MKYFCKTLAVKIIPDGIKETHFSFLFLGIVWYFHEYGHIFIYIIINIEKLISKRGKLILSRETFSDIPILSDKFTYRR